MSDTTLEASLRSLLKSRWVEGELEILWHAGEPLTVPRSFYERAFEVSAAYGREDLRVRYSIQTNGTLIDARWVELFAAHQVQVGLSLDGPDWLHDCNRRSWSRKGSHARAMRGLRQLQDAHIPVGALCVLSRESLAHADEIFDFFVGAGVQSVGFNVEETEGANERSSLVGDEAVAREYERFIRRLWYRWREQPDRIEIREFDRSLRVLLQAQRDPKWQRVPDDTVAFRNVTIDRFGNVTTFSPELAALSGMTGAAFVVGNVHERALDEMIENEKSRTLSNEVARGVQACKRSCEYFRLCGAGFVSNKYFEHRSVAATETVSCLLHRQTLMNVLLDELEQETANLAVAAQ